MSSNEWILGFDIGGTKTAVLAGKRDGTIEERLEFASQPRRGFQPMWDDIVVRGKQILATRNPPEAIGVSIGGPLDTARGIILSPPNLPGWDNIPLKQLMEDTFQIPAYVEHDARTGALAEWRFGAARGCHRVIFLTFGTGLGAGLILDDQLYRGTNDNSGDVGHWRITDDGPLIYGKRGSWEGYSSGAGIAALARERFHDHFPPTVTAADVIAQARAGDHLAQLVIDTSAHYLGRGISLLVDLLNPDIVVLGSLAVRSGDLFLPTVRRIVDEEAQGTNAKSCRIVPAELGARLGDVAAICAALNHIDPLKGGA